MDISNLAPVANLSVLPQELLFDVPARLPAKDISRLRTVCRPWRDLTSDPSFIKAHAARHPDQFIVASFHGDSEQIHIMDLSGCVVKRLPISVKTGKYLLRSCPDLVGVADVDGSCCLLDPVTGAISHLPKTVLKGTLQESDDCEYYSSDGWKFYSDEERPESCVFLAGRVDSTGEYKVIRIVCEAYIRAKNLDEHYPVSSVLTVNSGDRAEWRATRSHPKFLLNIGYMDGGVVIGSTIHFFWSELYPDGTQLQLLRNGVDVDCIASFDLEVEEWTSIPGPRPANNRDIYSMCYDSTLAELNGYLVVVHYRGYFDTMDLWFLADIENRLWETKYSLCTESVLQSEEFAKPLLLLDDGRIVIFLGAKGVLLLYDPTNSVVSAVETRRLGGVALYAGSLLSLQSDA